MEVSALRYSGGIRLQGASPLLRLQSDDRLIALMRRGNSSAFDVLVSRYHSRLLAFCRHLLGSKEDAEKFISEFGGEPMDSRDKGKGTSWAKWFKGRAAEKAARKR